MIQVLPPKRTFGSEFGRTFGGGAAKGLSEGLSAGRERKRLAQQDQVQAEQIEKENQALLSKGIDVRDLGPEARKMTISEQLKGKSKEDLFNKKKEYFSELLSGQEKNIGQDLASAGKGQNGEINQKNNAGFNPLGILDEDIVQATMLDPVMGNALRHAKDAAEKKVVEESRAKTKKEGQFFKFNEPKLAEIANTERRIDVDNARFDRLGELFTEPAKFPSGLMTALFTKEGTINDVAYSQMTPEAQEAVKLIIDSTSGIKDTYGARITNFDLQTYLRKLPSLIMSPEGRERVLRDLKEINGINQLYNRGIQEVFDEAGGSDKISFSQAERKFKQKYSDQLQKKLKEFSMPQKEKYNELPDANKFLGKKMRNPDTGEIFISDGKEWKPFLEGKNAI